MTEVFNRKTETPKRRQLRVIMPKPELILWSRLRGRQTCGVKFRRQYSVGPFVIDFYCPELKLAVEIDGDTHSAGGSAGHDGRRQGYVEGFGIRVIRFTNREVCENLDDVLSRIYLTVKDIKKAG